jgi:hypothetical protein
VRRIDEVADRFYDMGVALRRLREREMLDALSMTFDVLCKRHLGLSTSLAEKLVHVASTMTREQAIAMGQSKAIAMAAVAAATPEDESERASRASVSITTPVDGSSASALRKRGTSSTRGVGRLSPITSDRVRMTSRRAHGVPQAPATSPPAITSAA